MAGTFYVYFHRDREGNIFYVGKGTGDRAWSKDRHPVWHKFVNERLGGEYNVEIHRDGLTETDAERLEWRLITEMGKQLVNWVNWGRQFDYEAIGRYHELRDANRRFVAETRPLEPTDPEGAVRRYRQALKALCEYESITREHGLIAELGVGPDWGDPGILDRLTLCLIRLGRHEEAVSEANAYFARFPSALGLVAGRAVKKRVDKYCADRSGS